MYVCVCICMYVCMYAYMHACMYVFVYVLARVLNAVSGIFTEIDECESDPCQNGGTCNEGVNGYQCDCPPFISGINCETGKRCPMLGEGWCCADILPVRNATSLTF